MPDDSRRKPASSIASRTATASRSSGIRNLISRSSIGRVRISGGSDVAERSWLDQPLEGAGPRGGPVRNVHETRAALLVLDERGVVLSGEEVGSEAAQVWLVAHQRDGLATQLVQIGDELGVASRGNEIVAEVDLPVGRDDLAQDLR